MTFYRKLPVVIEARQLDGTENSARDLALWSGGFVSRRLVDGEASEFYDSVVIPTLEGNVSGEPEDYIIRGVEGEFYPCKPNIFARTYEAVES